ncbi:uncharacterized protein [Penaeus vannamei]|uniref:uncharacterized protein n=1 Tax=Penaeus vannamei TaxID=6689 RepID=UPI00387F4139
MRQLTFSISVLAAVQASDGMTDKATTEVDFDALLGDQERVASVEDVPEQAVAHHVAFPGKVSATEPYIDPATPIKVKAYAGITAILPCIVNNLGQRSVSWVRHRDIHVLTVGRFTFTNDERFEAHHEDGSNEWLLKLRFPTTNDSGTYECQINTKPTRTQLISLDVGDVWEESLHSFIPVKYPATGLVYISG